jgi:hypothetical protein
MEHATSHQDNLRLIAMPHILSIEKGRIDVQRPAGGSVTDLLRSIAWTTDRLHARVFIDGEYVKEAVWETTVPRPGQSVIVRAIPMGGGGGGGQGKDAARIVAMIAIVALAVSMPALVGFIGVGAALFAGTTAGAIALTVGTSIVGTLALNGLIPAPLPRQLPQPMDNHREVPA